MITLILGHDEPVKTLDEDILLPQIKKGVITKKFVDETVNIMMKF